MHRFERIVSNRAASIGMLFLCTMLSACETVQVVAVDSTPLLPNQGVLVMQVKSNSYARFNYIDYKSKYTFADSLSQNIIGSKGFVLANARLKQYIVMRMDAGDYAWMNIALPGASNGAVDPKNKFTVKANTLTYIGQIDLFVDDKRFSLHVADEAEDMRRYLAESFPAYSKSLPMVKDLARLQ